jgi:oxygen-independent coproporphyrinogen-3 oxidase
VEKGLPLHKKLCLGTLPAIRDDSYDCMYDRAASLLQARGFYRYEVSNFAKAGMISCHNQRYWTHFPYLGLGPGAHSFMMSCRRANPPSLDLYETWVNSGCNGSLGFFEHLSWQTLYAEAVWLGLRTIQGIDTRHLTTLYGMKPEEKKLTAWVKKGCLEKSGNRYYVKGKGWVFLDTLASDLMP